MKKRIQVSKAPSGQETLINLTPLIDVVFVILIMFIVVAPLLELDHVELASAGPGCDQEISTALQETHPISIHVRQDNTLWYNKQRVTQEQLRSLLVQARERYPTSKPLVFHDKKAHFGTYQQVKNTVESAGFKEMDVILSPK